MRSPYTQDNISRIENLMVKQKAACFVSMTSHATLVSPLC